MQRNAHGACFMALFIAGLSSPALNNVVGYSTTQKKLAVSAGSLYNKIM